MTYSPRAKAISGFALDREVTLNDVRGIVHPEDLPFTSAQARRALDPAVRDRSPYEYRIVRPNGAVRWVLAHSEAMFAQVGGETRATRYVGTLQDVTERRRLQEAERTSTAIAQRLGVSRQSVVTWRQRFLAHRLEGLSDAPRSGAPRRVGDDEIERLIALTLETQPTDATHWSTRSMAKNVGLSQTMVSRVWRAFGLQPHRQETFKLSRDPAFVDKVRDVVGL